VQHTHNQQFTLRCHIIDDIISRKSDPQTFANLIASGARVWEVAEDFGILLDLFDEARGDFFRCFGGKIRPNFC
jgi:hypothetical protein